MSPVTNAQRFVAALVTPLQDLETLWHQMRAMRNLNTSVGVHLTALGKLVKCPRAGITDDERYRRLCRAQIAVNNSCGSIDELLLIAELVVFEDGAEYIIDNTGVAALILRIENIELGWDVATLLIGLLRRAVFGGVRIVLHWWSSANEDDIFTFNGDSEDSGFPAFDGSGGGQLISAME